MSVLLQDEENSSLTVKKVKVVYLFSASTRSVFKALRYGTHCQVITQFYLHTLCFILKRNELYLPLPSQLWLVLIYRPRRDGRLSRPRCEVASAAIRTCNLPIANTTLYHTATSGITTKTVMFICSQKCNV